MIKSSWYVIPAAFFLVLNFSISSVKTFFFYSVIYFLFLFFLFFFLRKFDLSKILKFTIGGISAIIFLYGIIQKFILFPIYLNALGSGDSIYSKVFIGKIKSGRIFSIFTLPTLYAIVCGIFLIFIFHYLLHSPRRTFWGVLLFLGLVNLVLTQSFGGLIYLSFGVLIYLFLYRILSFKYLAPMVMVLSLFFFIVAGLRFSEVKELEPIKLRVSHWKQAIRIIRTSPLWGIGLGNYQAQISYYINPHEARSIYSHNFFLQFLAESGLLFPSILFFILLLSLKKIKPIESRDKVLYISSLFILFFYNLLDIGFYFFTAGLITVIILSQLYPYRANHNKKSQLKFKLNLAVLLLLGTLLGIQAFSESYRQSGDLSLNQGEFENSRVHYQKSLFFNPFNHRSLVGLAHIHFNNGNSQECESYLVRALNLFPEAAYANYLTSELFFQKECYFKSLFHANVAFRKNRLSKKYRNWYRFIKNNLQQRLPRKDG